MTHFGPTFDIPARCCYRSSIINYESMLLRIIGKRKLEEVKNLNNLKISPYNSNRGLTRMLNKYYSCVKDRLLPMLSIIGDTLSEQISLACSPHIKRKLRIKAINQLINKGECLNTLFMKNITCKIKIPEFAKNGKKPRLIGDYTCPGSLLAGFLIPIIKHAFSTPVIIENTRIRFVYSTDSHELDSIFTEMDNSVFDEYCFFSDDMCCKVHSSDGIPHWYNLDISSCDSSNGPAVFERAVWFFDETLDFGNLLTRAVLQCQQRVVIHHPAGKKYKEVITAQPTQPIEFSGTQLTTLLNNIASSAICISLLHYKKFLREGETFSELTVRAALAVGYEVTVDPCEDVYDVQFLKHSFYRVDGKLCSFVNLGTLLRSFGQCWMDLPYNTKLGESFEGAARMRNWQILTGFQHSGLQSIINVLLQSPCAKKMDGYHQLINRVKNEQHNKMYHSSTTRNAVPVNILLDRYRLTFDEFDELVELLSGCDLGQIITTTAIDKVVHKDYGYSLPCRDRKSVV